MNTTYQPTKIFTLQQANAMLPLVRAIATDASLLASEILERRERISELRAGRVQSRSDLYAEELSQVEQELDRQTDRLSQYADELRQLGAEPKSSAEGLVDFPALINGELAYLCWKLGEPNVLHWHPLQGGYHQRQPLGGSAQDRSAEYDARMNN
jgi:hypothetical protein